MLLEEDAEVNVRNNEGYSVLGIVQRRIASLVRDDKLSRDLETVEHMLKQRGAVL